MIVMKLRIYWESALKSWLSPICLPINYVQYWIEKPLPDYLQKCIDMLQTMSDKGLLNGLGELMDDEMKNFVRHKLRTESITLMKFYKQFPVI